MYQVIRNHLPILLSRDEVVLLPLWSLQALLLNRSLVVKDEQEAVVPAKMNSDGADWIWRTPPYRY
jgi:hypothetical protein